MRWIWLRYVEPWLERHQNPTSFWLHMVGIPMTLAAVGTLVLQVAWNDWADWWLGPALFLGGYGLQWLGHRIEGNDMGEVIVVKKMMNRPYVAVSPRYRRMTE